MWSPYTSPRHTVGTPYQSAQPHPPTNPTLQQLLNLYSATPRLSRMPAAANGPPSILKVLEQTYAPLRSGPAPAPDTPKSHANNPLLPSPLIVAPACGVKDPPKSAGPPLFSEQGSRIIRSPLRSIDPRLLSPGQGEIQVKQEEVDPFYVPALPPAQVHKPKRKSPAARQRPADQPNFLMKLYDVLATPEYQHILHWDEHDRNTVVIEQPELLQEMVLPYVYKQTKFASFSRQLNIYGFMRKTSLRHTSEGYTHRDASTWAHESLHCDSTPSEIFAVKRRVQARPDCPAPALSRRRLAFPSPLGVQYERPSCRPALSSTAVPPDSPGAESSSSESEDESLAGDVWSSMFGYDQNRHDGYPFSKVNTHDQIGGCVIRDESTVPVPLPSPVRLPFGPMSAPLGGTLPWREFSTAPRVTAINGKGSISPALLRPGAALACQTAPIAPRPLPDLPFTANGPYSEGWHTAQVPWAALPPLQLPSNSLNSANSLDTLDYPATPVQDRGHSLLASALNQLPTQCGSLGSAAAQMTSHSGLPMSAQQSLPLYGVGLGLGIDIDMPTGMFSTGVPAASAGNDVSQTIGDNLPCSTFATPPDGARAPMSNKSPIRSPRQIRRDTFLSNPYCPRRSAVHSLESSGPGPMRSPPIGVGVGLGAGGSVPRKFTLETPPTSAGGLPLTITGEDDEGFGAAMSLMGMGAEELEFLGFGDIGEVKGVKQEPE